jgi:hypothetical protein
MPNKEKYPTVETSTFRITEKLSNKEKYRKYQQATEIQNRLVEKDPKHNPTGRSRFASQYAPYENKAIISTIRLPDKPEIQQSSSPSRSQLLKARGTQSSAIRTLIK